MQLCSSTAQWLSSPLLPEASSSSSSSSSSPSSEHASSRPRKQNSRYSETTRLNPRHIRKDARGSGNDAPKDVVHPVSSSSRARPLSDHDLALLRKLCEEGQLDKAIELLPRTSVAPSSFIYKSLLQQCTKKKAIHHAKSIYAHVSSFNPSDLDGIVGPNLVVTLAKCGDIDGALKISDGLRKRSVSSWTALISSYVEHRDGKRALKLYEDMIKDDIQPNSHTYMSLFKACSMLEETDLGRKLHHEARLKGFTSNSFVGASLIRMYSKFGAIEEAEDAFKEISDHDIVDCTTMLSAYIEKGEVQKAFFLFRQMKEERIAFDTTLYVIALQACTLLAELEESIFIDGKLVKSMALEIGTSLHKDIFKKGYASQKFVGTTLLSMYGKCKALEEAEALFNSISRPDIVLWRAMLSAFVEGGQGKRTLQLYKYMQEQGMVRDRSTYCIALQACGILAETDEEYMESEGKSSKSIALEIGKSLIDDVRKSAFASDVVVNTSIVNMLSKCGAIVDAEEVFCKLSQRDIIAWTTMLSAYVERGEAEKALQLYSLMQSNLGSSDELSFAVALQACAIFAGREESNIVDGKSIKRTALEIGEAILKDARKNGFTVASGSLCNALLEMYAKCGAIKEAKDIFSLVKNRTPAAWNTMISMYIEYNQIEEALMLYREMQLSRGTMNDVTCIYILQVCTKIGSLELVKEIHFNVVSANYDSLLAVVATLIHAYGSCGSMEDANMLFNDIPEGQCDVITWNSYIALHAGEGNCEKAIELFEKMKDANVKPNESTFNSLLLACCRTGFVAEGVKYFRSMIEDHAISPNIQHYGILLDLLGRAGDFDGVKKTLESMPMEAPITIWLSLLSACRMHGNVEVAREAFSHGVRNWPGEESIYVLMSNIYSEAGMEQLAAVLRTDTFGNFRKYATPGVK